MTGHLAKMQQPSKIMSNYKMIDLIIDWCMSMHSIICPYQRSVADPVGAGPLP